MSVSSNFTNGVRIAVVTSATCILAFSGCGQPEKTSKNSDTGSAQHEQASESKLTVISGKDLQGLVGKSSEPVLVEFGVNFNCVRCDTMRPQMERLADDFEGRAKVVRVDYTANRRLVAQYGGTICPSYVLFHQGKPLVTRSYPTSADLLAADLDAVAARGYD